MRNIYGGIVTFWLLACVSVWSHAGEIGEDKTGSPVLSLRNALAMGIQHNLDLRAAQLSVPISQTGVAVDQAEFDFVLGASAFSLDQRTPTSSAFSSDDIDLYRETGADASIRKKFGFGLESQLTFTTTRSMNNLSVDALRPQYRNVLLLDLTQPLLRDFGTEVNTTNLRISQNHVRQAAYQYMDRAQRIGEEIEIVYYELVGAQKVLQYLIESRELTRKLLSGNQKKFEAGVIPITEVQEAETALASRDGEVVFARQQVEIATNKLKDLLSIGRGDPFYDTCIVTEEITSMNEAFPCLEEALAIALQKRPDLKRQQLEIGNSDLRIEYANNQKLPRIDLITTLGVNGLSGGDRPFTAFEVGTLPLNPYVGSYGDSLSSMVDADGREWYVGLRFSYPLGNRAAQARVWRSQYEKRQAIYSLKRLEETVETEVKNALVTVKRSLERIQVTERFEKLAHTTLTQEMERLREGLSDTFHILDFQDDLIEARIRKVKALVDLHKGLANLYRAMGTNLDRFDIIVAAPHQELTYAEQ